jgi:hypothetical protein
MLSLPVNLPNKNFNLITSLNKIRTYHFWAEKCQVRLREFPVRLHQTSTDVSDEKNEIKTKRKSFSNLSLFLWWPVPHLKYQYTGLNNNNSIPKHTKIFSHLVTGLSIHAPRTDGPWVGRKMTYDTIRYILNEPPLAKLPYSTSLRVWNLVRIVPMKPEVKLNFSIMVDIRTS